MKQCKVKSATILCKACQMVYGYDVETMQDGFRTTKCPYCNHEQMVWLEFRAIVVPVPVGYART